MLSAMLQTSSSPSTERVALITGANTGIGRVTALELASQGFRVFLAGRSLERTQPVLAEISASSAAGVAEWLPLDLADFYSVRACARSFLARNLDLHLLVNNAGLAGAGGLTQSGFEMAFGVNHMGHFLLTQLLLDRLRQSAPARVVTVASRAHTRVSAIDWDAVRHPGHTLLNAKEYCISKLANVLFSAELGRRLRDSGVSTYSLHPGVIASDLWRDLPWPLRSLSQLLMGSPEAGAKTTMHCCLSAVAANETGLYYSDCRPKSPSATAQDLTLADALWQHSDDWIR